MEKLSIKLKKADLDIKFLTNCKIFSVIPKFLAFNLPYANEDDTTQIRKRLLRSAIKKRKDERYKLDKDLRFLSKDIYSVLSSIDYYIVNSLININVKSMVNLIVRTHEKKLKNLTRNVVLPFTPRDTVMNLSKTKLTEEELDILKFGLKHSIEPLRINKTDVLTTFDFIHRAMSKDLQDVKEAGEVKAKMFYLANNYLNSYKPSKNKLRKHKILKKLRNNNEILITKPDKGNGVIIVDRNLYISSLYDIVNDTSKFLKLPSDPTITREGKLQRFVRTLKNKGFFTKDQYDRIYPCGSQQARLYGNPKTHKLNPPSDKLTFRPIVSSIGAYNYNLAKFLTDMLDPVIPKEHCAKDSARRSKR